AHPFRAVVDGQDYYYIFPNFRVKADLKSLKDLGAYEAFTPFVRNSPGDKAAFRLDHDASGTLRYAWKPGIAPLDDDQQKKLLSSGMMRPEEALLRLHDIETGASVAASSSSVFWNDYLKRWVMLAEQSGRVWYAEADTPVGPWLYARTIVS